MKTATTNNIFKIIPISLCLLVLLTACANERKVPPGPSTPPLAPSSMRVPLVPVVSSPLGWAYSGATRYNLERPDILISASNLFVILFQRDMGQWTT